MSEISGVTAAGIRPPVSWSSMLISAVALSMASLAPSVDAASAPIFTADGQIKAPLRFPLDPTYSSWAGGQRNVYTVAGSNGDVGYTLELPEEVGGGRFELVSTGGLIGWEDLDVTFYTSFSPVVSPGAYATRTVGGESGVIPDGSRFAVVTLFDGANASFRFDGYAPVAEDQTKTVGPPLPPGPSTPGIDPEFGKSGSAGFGPWRARLKSRSHVVIALVDTGINPYHVAFRRPEYNIHPSLYIEGFPADAPALGLSLDAPDYASARSTDDGPVWSKVDGRTLYWIPGTNVIGAYSVSSTGTPPAGFTARRIIDDHGHGTGVASVSAGAGVSSREKPFGSSPEALIVVVEGLGDEGVKWAAEQPWIDFISGSYGDPLAVPCNETVNDDGLVWCSAEYRYTAPFVLRDGRTACFSAGNGLSRTGVAVDRYSSLRPTSGPSWIITVGAASPRNEQNYGWHSVPVDVSSWGLHWPAAAPYSMTGEQSFGGTSNATPVTCGVFSRALLAARRALGDAAEGIHVTEDGQRVPALGRRQAGLLGDGVLTRQELQDAVLKTAFPSPFEPRTYTHDPVVVPDSPLYYTQEGYGIARVESALRAIDVLLGRAPMPDRSEVDAWIETVDLVRDTVYPPPQY